MELDIDPELLEAAFRVSGEPSRSAAVNKALEEYVGRRERPRILDLFGTIDYDPNYDYKRQRQQA